MDDYIRYGVYIYIFKACLTTMQQNETLGLADLTKEFYKLYNLMIAWTSNFKYWCLKLRQKNKTTYSDP